METQYLLDLALRIPYMCMTSCLDCERPLERQFRVDGLFCAAPGRVRAGLPVRRARRRLPDRAPPGREIFPRDLRHPSSATRSSRATTASLRRCSARSTAVGGGPGWWGVPFPSSCLCSAEIGMRKRRIELPRCPGGTGSQRGQSGYVRGDSKRARLIFLCYVAFFLSGRAPGLQPRGRGRSGCTNCLYRG